MSLTFSRRSFLKYTAVAAVAVAGSSLLTGCGEDEYQPTGKIGSTLKLMGEFKLNTASLETDTGTASGKKLVCGFDLKCTSKYGLNIVPANFQVEVTPAGSETPTIYHAFNTGSTGNVTLTQNNNYLKKDDSLTTELTVAGITVADGATIQVKFWPRPQASEGSQAYTRAFCTWKMVAKDDGTGSITLE